MAKRETVSKMGGGKFSTGTGVPCTRTGTLFTTDAQTDLSLRWAPSHFVGFVVRRLNSSFSKCQ